jgi:xylan 1,4-beta-xylosidase
MEIVFNSTMKRLLGIGFVWISCLLLAKSAFGQSTSFKTYMNPVIPGDHSDCTLTRVENDFYTTGSSFNPTPVIYHSTDLIHWEAIGQPVSAAWSNYGDEPAGGCWGGQIVYYKNRYWDFFGRAFVMYFVTADKPQGPWSTPTKMKCPSIVPGLGADNSIFIDSDSTWYLLVKNGQVNNWIVQLGNDGQPSGTNYNLSWLNPAPDYPYSWAEGPVMWKYKGYYFYSFARDVSGGQKVMRSKLLTGDKSSWTILGDFFNENDPNKSSAVFSGPNHSSAAIMLNDSTSWVMHPVWARANNNEWYGQGRQGLVNQVHYTADVIPIADYPVNIPKNAPKLPSGGIPWMVPKSDFFSTYTLNSEWSFLGYTPNESYSLIERPGWLRLKPRNKISNDNRVIKTDAEHNYSLITQIDFNASSSNEEAGMEIMNGLQTLYAKIYSSFNSAGHKVVCFSYNATYFETDNTIGTILWLKMVRVNHVLSGFFSADGYSWVQVGKDINIAGLDGFQPNYNGWCGNRQGLYTQGNSADFNLYIYRDAYTPILTECPANQFGTIRITNKQGITVLDSIHNNDWALYAGVEFGNRKYAKAADSVQIIASSASTGGIVEIWLDSLESGKKIGTCSINTTGDWNTFKSFTSSVDQITGRHDIYLKFSGNETDRLFQLQWVKFISKNAPHYVSSATTNDSTILIKLDKPITKATLPTGFIISLNTNENDSIKQADLISSDSSVISITLKKHIIITDTINLSYTNGSIKSRDSLELVSFTNANTDNLLAGSAPRILDVRTNANGDSVILKFNKKMISPSPFASDFKINTDLLNNPVNSISLMKGDSFACVLTLNHKIYYENSNSLTYSGTDVKSVDSGTLNKVTLLPIINLSSGYPPIVKSAVIRKTANVYNYIILIFDRILADVSNQKDYFTISINGQNATITALNGNNDSIWFSVNPNIKYGDIVELNYSGGSISSLYKGLLADISDYLIPNDLPLSIKTENMAFNNTVRVYPNPLSKEINVTSEIEFNKLSIFDMAGKLLMEKFFNRNNNSVSLSLNLSRGTYILKLYNKASSVCSKIEIL